MSIEIPNSFMAAAWVDPNPDGLILQILNTVFLSQRGFQAYNPATSAVDPSGAGIKGGFTYLGVGTYAMKTVLGSDPLNAIVTTTPQENGYMVTTFVPDVPEVFGPLADGVSLLVTSELSDGTPADFNGYQIHVMRFNEEESLRRLLEAQGLIP